MVFTVKYRVFRLKFSPQPIQWNHQSEVIKIINSPFKSLFSYGFSNENCFLAMSLVKIEPCFWPASPWSIEPRRYHHATHSYLLSNGATLRVSGWTKSGWEIPERWKLIKFIAGKITYTSLVGGWPDLPLWKMMDWVRQLGWFFHSQLNGKSYSSHVPNNQPDQEFSSQPSQPCLITGKLIGLLGLWSNLPGGQYRGSSWGSSRRSCVPLAMSAASAKDKQYFDWPWD